MPARRALRQSGSYTYRRCDLGWAGRPKSLGVAGRGSLISPGVAGRGARVGDPERLANPDSEMCSPLRTPSRAISTDAYSSLRPGPLSRRPDPTPRESESPPASRARALPCPIFRALQPPSHGRPLEAPAFATHSTLALCSASAARLVIRSGYSRAATPRFSRRATPGHAASRRLSRKPSAPERT